MRSNVPRKSSQEIRNRFYREIPFFVFFISGIMFIAVGAVVRSELSSKIESHTHQNTLYVGPIVLIVIGSLTVFIAFFGCCGAINSNYCMLMTFACILLVIFLAEFAIGIAAYVKKDEIKSELKDWMKKEAEEWNKDEVKDWDNYQEAWKCCGWNLTIGDYCDPKDKNCALPQGCCTLNSMEVDNKTNCTVEHAKKSLSNCYDETVEFVDYNITKIGGVGIGFAFIQLLGLVVTCCYELQKLALWGRV